MSATPLPHRPWVVLKFGGTSVATAERWATIARRVEQLRPEHRIWIVASALSQISNRLERSVADAVAGRRTDELDAIEAHHRRLADELGLEPAAMAPVEALLAQLRALLEGVQLLQEASPRVRARIMSFGELASTALGVAALARHGLTARRVDARSLLHAEAPPGTSEERRFLEAVVPPRLAPAEIEAAADGADVVLTQGFIADQGGQTCLLGRGGSDTSGALFAALAQAARLEIWTDVHGLFTADPRHLPTARLIRRIAWREAQELAAMGAKVLHPRCLGPARFARIPVEVRNTADPDSPGTLVGPPTDTAPGVLAIVQRRNSVLLTLSTLTMWDTPGFLAQAFAPFAELGISIDLVATSQSAVTVTLDRVPGGVEGPAFAELLRRLGRQGEVTVVPSCAVVSIVGRRIRAALPELGPAFAAFSERNVHLVSESSEDHNLSFVVDDEDADKLVSDLHDRLIPTQGSDDRLGRTWEQLGLATPAPPRTAPRWWRGKRDELLALASAGPRYVLDLPTVRARARALRTRLPAVGRVFYAMKANDHADVLRVVAEEGLGLECVSAGEVRLVRSLLPDVPILFTPNFCPVDEYRVAFEAGADVTVDGPDVLEQAPSIFEGRALAVRVDPGGGAGHHAKVVTAGAQSKFGHPVADLDAFVAQAAALGARVTGLHSHVGSGIHDPATWARTAERLLRLRDQLPELRWMDVGGGLGVVERPDQIPLDLDRVQERLASLGERLGDLELRMEPGRYVVSEAGVLLAPVTQVRRKGSVRLVGVGAGMNALLRPALYGAWHAIHNLSRLDEPATGYAHVVGPICESGDVLGHDRLLPDCRPGDVLLIENAGAYGRVMGSSYNRRPVPEEIALGN